MVDSAFRADHVFKNLKATRIFTIGVRPYLENKVSDGATRLFFCTTMQMLDITVLHYIGTKAYPALIQTIIKKLGISKLLNCNQFQFR